MAAGKHDTNPSTGSAADGFAETLAQQLLARSPAEDLAFYDDDALRQSAQLAYSAVKRHRKGQSVIVVARDPGIQRQGRRVTVVTVVNDNMPFLFDSIMGEISEVSDPYLVAHPVVPVVHARTGVTRILPESGSKASDAGVDRISVIHVHLPLMDQRAAEALEAALGRILANVRLSVADWKPMLARLEQAISTYRYAELPLRKASVDEAVAFLEWLRDDNFTFLGMRDYKYSGDAKTGMLERVSTPGLGILSDPDTLVLRSGTEAVTTTPEIRAFLHGPDALIVTKANTKSLVHRRVYLDYVGVKTFDARGRLVGELRMVGLFTSTAYTRSVLNIPYLRSKARDVIVKSGFDPADHSGKALTNVLESYPRDELFQIDTLLLRKHAAAVLALGERPRIRVLVRLDRFDRFVSVIVYVPRDRYDSPARERIGAYLATVFDGHVSAFYPAFPEGGLARVHFIIGRRGGRTPKIDPQEIERGVRSLVMTWEDALSEAAEGTEDAGRRLAIAARFPKSYRGGFSAGEALRDAGIVARVDADNPIAVDYYRRPEQDDHQASLKIHHHGQPVTLSRRVPLLENMGFRVVSERTFEIPDIAGGTVFLHDMEIENAFGGAIALEDGGALFEEVFLSVWNGLADNDGYNALAQTAGMGARPIQVLRAYGRYLQQAGIPQGQDFVAAVLNRHPRIARALHDLFATRFDPARGADAKVEEKHLKSAIRDALADVPSLDDDTILRRYQNLIEATLRTNHFAEARGLPLAIKLDSRAVEGLPEPRPWREVFVYGPRVEGVHLRFGPIARGGLRWSDRALDYRTEVLGLVKAQQVKNAVIVPVGAKGGFYPKTLPTGPRDAVFAAGKAAYVEFVTSLLSITDDIEGDAIVPPAGVTRLDGDDPYFVVAADKGTATFSDTANAISLEHGFWLDDAFASGGSAGYDHKKMGITARGAWEAVKRHFREMNRDIQEEPFTVAGVGDMSGDVFGNGMLLSRRIRLIAAFDHRDIFIDPDPDPETSFAERERLFALPRSSWQDYDREKLSTGGGIHSRTQKSISLSEAAAAAIGLDKRTATPNEIITAILKAEIDLLWFGGIGTYVRATTETDLDVGDRANDAIRVTAPDLRAKVIGEGANLGLTQHARIEFGRGGGRCNSDAIDNSAGVNSSDVEVNIKIGLAAAMRSGKLTRPNRNKLLAAMTDEVAALVLANNYQQTLAISLAQDRGADDLMHQARLMTTLERQGLLDRAVEDLPSDAEMTERNARGEPLTRAELGVLLAYAKMTLLDELVRSGLPDEPWLEAELLSYFPARMTAKYRDEILGHRLRREIIATALANDAINRGGPSFISRMEDASACPPHEVVDAYVQLRDGFELDALYGEVDALDNRIDGQVQLGLYQSIGRLVHAGTAWMLRNRDPRSLAERIAALRKARAAIEPRFARMAGGDLRERIDARAARMRGEGVPETLAARLALLPLAEMVPEMARVAALADSPVEKAAEALLSVNAHFRVGRIEEAARLIAPSDYFDGLALSRAHDMIAAARRGMAVAALERHGKASDPVGAWLEAGGPRIARARERLQSLTEAGDMTVSRLSVAAAVMNDLTGL